MYPVAWKEFVDICHRAFIVSALIFCALGVSIPIDRFLVSDWNDSKAPQFNAERLQQWRDDVREVNRYNAVLTAYRDRRHDQIGWLPSDNRVVSYVSFVIDLEEVTTPQAREAAYLRYRRIGSVDEHALTLFQYRAITDPGMDLGQRLERLAPAKSENELVDRVTSDFLRGQRSPQSPPPRPRHVVAHNKITPEIFRMLLILAVSLSQLSMLIYFFCYGTKNVNGKRQWAVPINVGSWLIMLLYAPAFLLPWIGRLLWYILTHAVFVPVAWIIAKFGWLLFQADMMSFMHYATQQARARRDEEHRRLEEIAVIGQDVIGCRLELAQARKRAESTEDTVARHIQLQKIDAAEKLLDAVAKQKGARAATTARATADSSSARTASLDDLLIRIEALHETEKLTPIE